MNRRCGSYQVQINNVIRWWVLGCLLSVLAGCSSDSGSDSVSTAPAAKATKAVEIAVAERSIPELWAQSCALCHVDGNGTAPRMGNSSEWAPRLAKGADVLLKHTLEGFNQMPPLGYCMACERDDFVALIEFMTQNMVAEQTSGSAQ